MAVRIRTLLLLCLPALAAAEPPASLDEILRCNADALGGEPAFERVENLRIALDISEPGFEVTATYVASRDGRMRIDITAGGERVFAEGLDGEGAWQWTPQAGVKTSSAAGAAALRHGIELPGRFWTLRQLHAHGARLEWLEPGPLARPDEWQLQLTLDDGAVIDHMLDRSSCLPTREVSRRAFHPDVDATEVLVETISSEPEQVDGVLRFKRGESRIVDTGEWLGTTVVRGFESNVDLPDGFFEAG
jgi:hypothetical protein